MIERAEQKGTSETDPVRWRRVKELFFEVLEQPESRRPGLLNEIAGAEPEIKKEVEELLAAHSESKSFIEKPAFEVSSTFGSDAGAARPTGGKHFGR